MNIVDCGLVIGAFQGVGRKLVLFKAKAANLKLVLLRAYASLRLTTPKVFTLTLGILGTLASLGTSFCQ